MSPTLSPEKLPGHPPKLPKKSASSWRLSLSKIGRIQLQMPDFQRFMRAEPRLAGVEKMFKKNLKKGLTPDCASAKFEPHTVTSNNTTTLKQMKKTLLIAAAALAAGVITSQAQVYSQNVVGYVNKPLPLGFVNVANPLTGNNGNNSITNIIDVFSANYDGSGLYIWTGTAYAQYTIDSSWSSGIGNAADTAEVNPPPTVAPGNAIFLANSTGIPLTNTFVGEVYKGGPGASTNVVGLATNNIPTGFRFIASQMAIGGGLQSVLQFPASGGNFDGCAIYVPNIVGGNVQGFIQYTVDSGWTSGFGNAADTAEVAEPVIPVGSGFFINNSTGTAQQWIQSL